MMNKSPFSQFVKRYIGEPKKTVIIFFRKAGKEREIENVAA